MFEHRELLLVRRGESLVEAELRRVLDGIGRELGRELGPDWVPHGRCRGAGPEFDVREAPDGPDGPDGRDGVDACGGVEAGDPVDGRGAGDALDARLADGAARLDRLATEGGEHLGHARQAQRDLSRAAAEQARALAAFARCRPSSFDRPESEIGAAAARTRASRPAVLTPVSEWAVDEVSTGLGLTGQAAEGLLVDSLLLVDRLPATLDALAAGRISWAHAQVMTELVAPLRDEVRAAAELRLLTRVDGRTRTQLRAAARRLVMKLDAASVARRVTEAVRRRRVTVYAGDDGMATLSAVLPAPVARAVQDALRRYADAAATEGDERTREQRMVDCLVDLVLRPGEHGLAPVQARLTLVAAVRTLLGGDEPGEVDGDLVPAEMVRELAVALGLMPRLSPEQDADEQDAGEQEAGEQDAGIHDVSADVSADDGSATAAADDGSALGDPAPGARAALADLLTTRDVRGTALTSRPGLALVDELSGQLVALTDAFTLRAGRGLGPPPETPGYRPAADLDRFVRLRDRRCRFPGCRARPIRCDLDHTVPYPHGPTTHDNLCCLCRHHHRLSHQAPGWTLRGLPDGGLQWTTPTGQVLVTHPPRFGADDDLPTGDPRPPDRPPTGVFDDPPPDDPPPDGSPHEGPPPDDLPPF